MAVSSSSEERRKINEELLKNGVNIIDINSTYIEDTVKVGIGTIIYPNNVIEGNTVIGEKCIIGPNNRILDSVIGNENEVQSSVLVECLVGDNNKVGPFAYLRPKAQIGNESRIGDFVEIKNSTIGDGTKVSHLTYIGDAEVGKHVNFGCGTTIANYDGKNKHKTVIGDETFIGCNTNLVAPVTLGKGVYTAAGSTVTKDIPDFALVIARSRETIVEEWAKDKYRQ